MGECLIIRGGGGTDTSNANATASVVLTGYTCYVDDQLIAGSMPVQTLNQKLGAGGSVTIPAGYYDGSSSVISTSTLAEETAANAASSHILSGYNGWVNGGLVQGSMANWGNTGATLAANGVYWIPAGWHAGAGVVNQSLAVHWGGTYTPNTGNQVMCWAGWYTGGDIVVLGSSNLIASNIRNNINIFGVWGTFVGVPSRESDYFVWARGVGQTPYCAPGVWITTSYPINGSIVWHSLVRVWGVNSHISGGWDRLLVSTNVHSRDSTSWTTFWVYNSSNSLIGQWTSGPAGLSGIQSFAIWFNNSSQSMNFGVDASQIYSIWIETSRTVAWLEWDTLWMKCDVL